MRRLRLGVFGGTFDPVHYGHLLMAQEAALRLRLDRLLFVPAHRQPLKPAPRASGRHREAMLRIATRGVPGFSVSNVELERAGFSYTVDTLAALHRPATTDLYFLLGQDSLEDWERWRESARILSIARLVVLPRDSARGASRRGAARMGPAATRRIIEIKPPSVGISSTAIRDRVRRGLPIRFWTPDPVARYIARHGLYRTRRRAA